MKVIRQMHIKHLKCLVAVNYLLSFLKLSYWICDTTFWTHFFKVIFMLFLLFRYMYSVSSKGLSLTPFSSAGCAFWGKSQLHSAVTALLGHEDDSLLLYLWPLPVS